MGLYPSSVLCSLFFVLLSIVVVSLLVISVSSLVRRSIERHRFSTMNDSILVPALGVISLVLGLLIVIYRLYAHPLAGFPGPKVAAATFLYEFYYDVVKGGMYIWEIERMHEKYGTSASLSDETDTTQWHLKPDSGRLTRIISRSYRPNQSSRATHQRSILLRHHPCRGVS